MNTQENMAGNGTPQKTTSIVPVSSGLSRLLAVQFNAVMGPLDPQGTEVSLRMFIDGDPDAQAANLGTHFLIPNGTPVALATGQHNFGSPPAPYSFSAVSVVHTLQISLVSANGNNHVRITGSIDTSWTLGAVDMELLDPLVVEP